MADYYTVLNKAIEALADNSGEARRLVYDRARKALVRQLEAIDPPLSPSDITRQRLALEESIRTVEGEHASGAFGLSAFPGGAPMPETAPTAEPAPPQAPPVAPPTQIPPVVQPAAPQPTNAPQPAAPIAPPQPMASQPPADAPAPLPTSAPMPSGAVPGGQAPVAQGQSGQAPVSQSPGAQFAPNPLNTPAAPTAPPAENVSVNAFRRAVDEASQLPNRAGDAAATARSAITGETAQQQPRLEPRFGAGAQPEAGQTAAIPAAPDARPEPGLDDVLDGDSSPYDDPEIGRMVERTNPFSASRTALLLGGAALALIVIVGGIFVFLNSQSDLDDLDLDVAEQATAVPDRLTGNETDTAATDPSRVAPDAERVETRPVETRPVETPAADESQLASTELSQETPAETPAPATPSVDAAIPITQRAILYEETDDPALNNTLAVSGNVVWRERQSPAAPGSRIADVEVSIPERGFSMTMVVRENLDQAVEASNILEVTFKMPEGYKGGSVTEIPGLILKSTENARGDLLIGTEVRIASNIFWLALSGLSADITANRNLLKDREWIDVPLKFANGQRGLIAFEKGTEGGRILSSVVDSWTATQPQQ